MSKAYTLIKKIFYRRPLYVQLLFTASAFLLMVVLSYNFMGKIVLTNLECDVGNVFDSVQDQINYDLMEPQTMLFDFAKTICNMIQYGDNTDRLQDFTADISNHTRLKEKGRLSGLYGYIEKIPNGPVFLNGLDMEVPDNYSPVDRSWYTAAIAAGGEIVETLPYKDMVTGENILTYSCSIHDNEGAYLGVVCIDVKIDYIGKKIINSAFTKYGYGILVSQDLTILTHSNPDFVGMKMYDTAVPISIYADEMLEKGIISGAPLINWKGEKSIIFTRKLPNGWFLTILTIKSVYYKNLTDMALILSILGFLLAAVLIFVLIRVDTAREKSDMESRHKSAFLANMSHEMRTPMNAIIGMTNIGKNAPDTERKDYCFMKIEDASNHLLGVINDILDISKIEANKFEISSEEFSFEKMLQKVVNVVSFRIDEKQQKFSVHIDRAIPKTLIGDDQRLAQVITNLLGNSVKFTPAQGSISLAARLTGEENGLCTVKISVSDTGIGISPEQQAKLFRSFQQAEAGTTRKYGGTGLGLAISKRIVEMMGGRIWIESEPGKGSTFGFTIQARRGNGKELEPLLKGINRDNVRIMAVDDDPDILTYFSEIMHTLGLSCDTAGGGDEALALVQRNGPYHIYFVDWKMLGMSGIQLATELKKRGSENSVVIMISAAEWTVIAEEAKKAGVDKFLSKPLFQSSITEIINECFGKNKNQAEKDQSDIEGVFAGRHILLAEDVEINREVVQALLEPTQVQIDCAVNGKEALDMFSQASDKYDMIFMDMQMPEMDGYEATHCIRALDIPKAKTIPIVAMTANVFREDVEKCLQAGMNSHIGKPLNFDDVIERMHTYLPLQQQVS